MITGNYKQDVVRVAENLLIALSVEFIKSAPNIERWEKAIENCFDIAKTIVNKEYKFLNIDNNESKNNQRANREELR